MKKVIGIGIMVIALVVLWQREGNQVENRPVLAEDSINVQLDRVVDGDTIIISMNGERERVRLIGVDTPESTTENVSVECFGLEASQFLKDLLEHETDIFIEFDDVAGQRDRYGRILAHVFLDSGENINQTIISEGYGHEYTYQGQDYRYKDIYKQSEISARQNEIGLWAESACM